MTPDQPTVVAGKDRRGLPFSKGLLAQSFMATGLAPSLAWGIAQAVQDEIVSQGAREVSASAVRDLAHSMLLSMAGPEHAMRYERLREMEHLDRPLIVLIGGTTGVGKSTIATNLATRLGITRISSTDSIREVMRGIFTPDLMPAIHESAFSAWQRLRVPVPEGANPVIVGFREQTAVVSTGIMALVNRAVTEGDSMVIEGIHLVPGYLDLSGISRATIVQLVIGVEDDQSHLSHFYTREAQTEGARPRERYVDNFENIRVLGEYIEGLARANDIPIIYSHQFDRTMAEVLELVVTEAIEKTPLRSVRKRKER